MAAVAELGPIRGKRANATRKVWPKEDEGFVKFTRRHREATNVEMFLITPELRSGGSKIQRRHQRLIPIRVTCSHGASPERELHNRGN